MNQQQVERFFKTLSKEWDRAATVILTGAAAGGIWGSVRPSLDIDFAIKPRSRAKATWEELDAAIQRTTRLTGLPVNYAEDIDRWGAITLMDYRKQAKLHKKFGKLRVCLMDPCYWAIGKLTRYLDPDIQDLVCVLKTEKIPATRLVRVLGRALKNSPASLTRRQFSGQVEHFLSTQGHQVWGHGFSLNTAVVLFHKAAAHTERFE